MLLLTPGTPMLFQGQEFASTNRFYYFADHQPALAKMVREGRATFLGQFRSLSRPEVQEGLADPGNPNTFQKCKLDFSDRDRHAAQYALHKDLMKLRREDPVLSRQGEVGLDGAVLSEDALVIRYFGTGGDDRLLLINLGSDLHLEPAPEPLLAPVQGTFWKVLWSSEDVRYGGSGGYPPEVDGDWLLPGQAAVVMQPATNEDIADA